MALLIWTVTLCLCAAAVTLSHDWRPARLLVANLRHTQGAHCFLNRIVKSLAQGPSKIRRLSKLLITLRDDPSEASWLHLREGCLLASSFSLGVPCTRADHMTQWKIQFPRVEQHKIWIFFSPNLGHQRHVCETLRCKRCAHKLNYTNIPLSTSNHKENDLVNNK